MIMPNSKIMPHTIEICGETFLVRDNYTLEDFAKECYNFFAEYMPKTTGPRRHEMCWLLEVYDIATKNRQREISDE
jgi:hypothetical protein